LLLPPTLESLPLFSWSRAQLGLSVSLYAQLRSRGHSHGAFVPVANIGGSGSQRVDEELAVARLGGFLFACEVIGSRNDAGLSLIKDRARRWYVAAGTMSLAMTAPANASPASWDRASSIARTGIVSFSLGLPAAKGDWSGLKQDTLALGATAVITEGLKLVSHEQRPDGSDDHSFPSGHTSISFAAAAGIEQRYGWKLGLPAHLAAAFVGLARVEANKHHLHDVVIGAAIGEAAGLLLAHKRRHAHNAPLGAGFSIVF
jgi:hypothetical protein